VRSRPRITCSIKPRRRNPHGHQQEDPCSRRSGMRSLASSEGAHRRATGVPAPDVVALKRLTPLDLTVSGPFLQGIILQPRSVDALEGIVKYQLGAAIAVTAIISAAGSTFAADLLLRAAAPAHLSQELSSQPSMRSRPPSAEALAISAPSSLWPPRRRIHEIITFSNFCAGRSNTAPCAEAFLNDLPPSEDWEQISSRGRSCSSN
jgi:hypothetical protein